MHRGTTQAQTPCVRGFTPLRCRRTDPGAVAPGMACVLGADPGTPPWGLPYFGRSHRDAIPAAD